MAKIFEKEDLVPFPHLEVLKASAGSGKTHALTQRIVQFLLSENIPNNKLRNILAVTFSNNAAKEMKERTLATLKNIYFTDDAMKPRAEQLIDTILENYADFQIKTIDSFMTTVFKSSAIDFGYHPDFDIVMDNTALMKYAFDLFLRNVKSGTSEASDLCEIVDALMEYKGADTAYPWIPSVPLFEETKKMDTKLSAIFKQAIIEDYHDDKEQCERNMTSCVGEIEKEIERSGLKRHGNSAYKTIPLQIRKKDFQELVGKLYTNPPVTKPPKGKADEQATYDQTIRLWEEFKKSAWVLTAILCRSRCTPYIKTLHAFRQILERTKKQQGKIFIGDINCALAEYLDSEIVPDVYFRMGEVISHFLIDEFQDTAPIQWKNLFLLIENALSQGGSLFVVGDTKQSIYSFRNADYTIMKALENCNPFPSAKHSVSELEINHRSLPKVLEFNEQVFKINVANNETYRAAGEKSGLTDYIQHPEDPDNQDGYVAVSILEKLEDEPAEREKIQGLILELYARGYGYKDIAILTQSNADAVRMTAWLNEKEFPFISYSSLDIRQRKIIGEIMALIHFLDSPTDDFSFGTFILGEIFNKTLQGEDIQAFCFKHRRNLPAGRIVPLYKAFQDQFGELWERHFEGLFKVAGFLPLYDLVTQIFVTFNIFQEMPKEEAALIQFLEVVSSFEQKGLNSLTDFLAIADDEQGGTATATRDVNWNMAVPKNTEAVKIMTIHKSKGLGFPVVIVLLYHVQNKGLGYVIEENGEIVHLLKIKQNEAECDETLCGLYEAERMREMVNQLNTLYVGFTRPERELYVIGVTNKPDQYPFLLLPVDDYPPAKKPEYHPRRGDPLGRPVQTVPTPLLHRCKSLEFPLNLAEFIPIEERRRGEFIHRVLFFIEDVGADFEGIIRRVNKETGSDYAEAEMKSLIVSIVNNNDIKDYFKRVSDREIKREQEYVDGAGNLFRMDRVVIDPKKVTVIDYKTGSSKVEKYQAQLQNYMRILGEIYRDRIVTGLIVYVDLNEVVEVRL